MLNIDFHIFCQIYPKCKNRKNLKARLKGKFPPPSPQKILDFELSRCQPGGRRVGGRQAGGRQPSGRQSAGHWPGGRQPSSRQPGCCPADGRRTNVWWSLDQALMLDIYVYHFR